MIKEYCISFVTGPDDIEGSDDNVVYHTHVFADTDDLAVALAYMEAAQQNINLSGSEHVVVASTAPVPPAALVAYTRLRQQLRGLHQDGAPGVAGPQLPPTPH